MGVRGPMCMHGILCISGLLQLSLNSSAGCYTTPQEDANVPCMQQTSCHGQATQGPHDVWLLDQVVVAPRCTGARFPAAGGPPAVSLNSWHFALARQPRCQDGHGPRHCHPGSVRNQKLSNEMRCCLRDMPPEAKAASMLHIGMAQTWTGPPEAEEAPARTSPPV